MTRQCVKKNNNYNNNNKKDIKLSGNQWNTKTKFKK